MRDTNTLLRFRTRVKQKVTQISAPIIIINHVTEKREVIVKMLP